MSLYAFVGAIETGLAFALVALGAYVTFRVLDFPDLTVEGSFPFGAAVAAALMIAGVNPWLATAMAALAGAVAGLVTGLLNLKFRILNILSGILTAIALYSINLRVMGRPNIGLIGIDTVYSTVEHLGIRAFYAPVVLLTVVVIICKLLLDLFLSTGYGLAMRAAGSNPRMARANGINVDRMIYIGLAIANALTALSGALFATDARGSRRFDGNRRDRRRARRGHRRHRANAFARHRACDARLRRRLPALPSRHRAGAEFERYRLYRVRRQSRQRRAGGDRACICPAARSNSSNC